MKGKRVTKIELFRHLTAQRAHPCASCTNDIFKIIMDPLTQSKLEGYEKIRDSFFTLHVHNPTPLDGGGTKPVIMFYTWVEIKDELYIPYVTPSASTLEKAFQYFNETLKRERRRLRREAKTSDCADGQVAPRAPKNPRRRNKVEADRAD
jgi:hypothetical protein